MRRVEDDARAMAEAASLEAFLDARLPGGDAGFVGWTRAAAAAAVASGAWAPAGPAELPPLLERWAARPTRELQERIALVVARTSAGAEVQGARAARPAVETAAAALSGVGSPWRIGAELAIDAARRSCRGEPDLRALEHAVAATLHGPPPHESLVPPPPRSAASVPPGAPRLPPGWRLGGGFDDALGRPRTGATAPREWLAEPRALEHVAHALEVALGARVLDLSLERSRARALRADLRLELDGLQARVRLDRDPRGAAEASLQLFGEGAETRFPELCAALDEALEDAARRHGAATARDPAGTSLRVHVRDAAQSVTSLLRGRPILPSGMRWADDDAVGPWPFTSAFAELVPLVEALEGALAAPGTIALYVRGRAPRERVQLTVSGEHPATLDVHASEVRVRATSHAIVAAVARALAAAGDARTDEGS